MVSEGMGLIRMAYHPEARLRELLKAMNRMNLDDEREPTRTWDATSLLDWIWSTELKPIVGDPDYYNRALVLCMFFGGLRFAELARMVWTRAVINEEYGAIFWLHIKKKSIRSIVKLHKFPEVLANICPFRALMRVKERSQSDAVWRRRADTADPTAAILGRRVSWVLGQANLPTGHPYRVKKASSDYLVDARCDATTIARFFRHVCPYTHDKSYTHNDFGLKAQRALFCQYFRARHVQEVCV
jgi:hypothetical protein